jgi:FkbM family methyltransferase
VLRQFIPAVVKRFLWRSCGECLGLSRRLASGHVLQIRSYSDWCIYNDIFADGEYDPGIRSALSRSNDGSPLMVLDLGANAGFFTLRVLAFISRHQSKSAVTMVLVEPSHSLVRRLQATFAAVSDPRYQIRIVRGLVGEKTGRGHLQVRHEQIGNAVIDRPNGETEEVEYIDVEQWIGPDVSVDLLKCDIEGSEGRFIDNFADLLKRTTIAMFEFHEPTSSAATAIPKLIALGLRSAKCLKNQGPHQTWMFHRIL